MDEEQAWAKLGGHAQTILAATWFKPQPVSYQRERWETPDGDFIDVDFVADSGSSDRLCVLFHGLEGSSQSHYARAFAHYAKQHHWNFAVVHFRGCSGELNRLPRAYHSGDYEEIDWILQRFRLQHHGFLLAVGISLGGNALALWAGKMQAKAALVVDAIASICAPLDLHATAQALDQGLCRRIYTPRFLSTLKKRALLRLTRFPKLFDAKAISRARTLYDFDHHFTAPVHGFQSANDYWARASALPYLKTIAIPALLVNPLNDPFVPSQSLPPANIVSPTVHLWRPPQGGHVGFYGKKLGASYLPLVIFKWTQELIERACQLAPPFQT